MLRVGGDGVSVIESEGRLLTIERSACLAVQLFDDGARILSGPDSISIFVHPAMWEDGEEAVAAIDGLFDPRLHVAMGEPSGYDPPIDDQPESKLRGLLRRIVQ